MIVKTGLKHRCFVDLTLKELKHNKYIVELTFTGMNQYIYIITSYIAMIESQIDCRSDIDKNEAHK